MARLIDADALVEKFNEKCDMATVLVDEKTAERFHTFCVLQDAVEDAPTVDAVEVVRCKDCKNMLVGDKWVRFCNVLCKVDGLGDNGYCSYGEKREAASE